LRNAARSAAESAATWRSIVSTLLIEGTSRRVAP
jgi:hypothetical protein